MIPVQDTSKSNVTADSTFIADKSKESPAALVSPAPSDILSTPVTKKSDKRHESGDCRGHGMFSPRNFDQQSPISVLSESPVEKYCLSPSDDDESDDDIL